MDKVDMIYDLMVQQREDIKSIKEDVESLKMFKNKIVGAGIVLSFIFAFIFDTVKNIIIKRV